MKSKMPNEGSKKGGGSKKGATMPGYSSSLSKSNAERKDGKSGIKHHNPYPRGLA